ncbi:neuropilin and tolloid-like protein 2 [Asterias rubens]|uniref:neuropilin and tolloid-like protein 2 n=1 Tax=Asterias rubens TaxID=7604 RepID=UPI0014551A6D|nr:neuropilin and tolloid-like protein 2 [Asterias rubens]
MLLNCVRHSINMSNSDSLAIRLIHRVKKVLLLVIILGCCGQDGADDGPRVIFPEPNTYKSATQYEWLFDTDTPQDEFYFNSFYYPAVYPASLEIQYFFEAGENEVVEVTFNADFEIEYHDECVYDYLEVRDGRYGFSPLIGKYCGDKAPINFTTTSRYLWILFVADEDLEYTGFEAYFRFIPAPPTETPRPEECFFHIANLYDGAFSVKEARDLIRHTDPHAPIDCTWQIDVEDVSKILIKFDKFELNNKNECMKNRIMIYDMYSAEEWLIGEYCSTTAPAAMTISNRMFVRFVASNQSSYNNVNMMFTAYTDRPCDENIVFPCGPYMCLNKSLVCNGRENCWSYGFDEEASMCEVKDQTGWMDGKVDIVLAVTMGIIVSVTVITTCVTCRHSCLRTREKAKTMASKRRMMNQQVQLMMDKENQESHEMNSLGDKYNTQYSQFPSTRTNNNTGGPGVSTSSHDFPMTNNQMKEYEKIMDSELGFEPRQQRPYVDPDSPWVRANQYNESFRRSAAQPLHPNKEIQIHF